MRELIKSRSKHWSIKKKKIKETGFGLTRVETNSTSCTVVSPSHFLDALIQNFSLIQKHWHRCLNHLLCWGFRSTASKYSRMCFITQLTGSRVQRGGHKQWVLYVKKKQLTEGTSGTHVCQPGEAAVKQLQIHFTEKELGLIFIHQTF